MLDYVNIPEIVGSNTDYLFYIFIGGRGIGKTYSTLRDYYLQDKKILYVRYTQEELNLCMTNKFNPYKAINRDLGTHIQVITENKSISIVDCKETINEEGKKSYEVIKEIGTAVALSTFGNVRGADYSDIDVVVFDEFIPKKLRLRNKNDDIDFFNLIETVIRDRELRGEHIPVILISNADGFMSNILKSLKLVNVLVGMEVRGINIYTDLEKAIYMERLESKNLMNAKAQTRLYRATKGTEFYDMAIGNEFVGTDYSDLKKVNFNQYYPICMLNGLYFYQYKGDKLEYIASKHKSDCYCYDGDTTAKYVATNYYIKHYYEKNLKFTDYESKMIFIDKFLKQ